MQTCDAQNHAFAFLLLKHHGLNIFCISLCVCCMQNERDVIEVFSLQMPCIFKGILENEKVLRVIGTLFGSVPMGLSFARVSRLHSAANVCSPSSLILGTGS